MICGVFQFDDENFSLAAWLEHCGLTAVLWCWGDLVPGRTDRDRDWCVPVVLVSEPHPLGPVRPYFAAFNNRFYLFNWCRLRVGWDRD